MLFDSHCHLNFEAFENNWKKVIDNCQKNNVWLVNVGSQYPTSKRAVEIAEKYEHGVYASVGVHPIHAHEKENTFDYKKFRDLIATGHNNGNLKVSATFPYRSEGLQASTRLDKKIVAIGETGLDFFHSAEYFEIQKETFIKQINLAKEFDLSLIIHGRNSKDGRLNCYQEIYKIVKKEKVSQAVVHCFGGTADEAKPFMALGLYIGITGIVTFRNAKEIQKIAQEIPLERILIETDAPWLAPEPHRGERNLPQYVEFVARKIAELKGLLFEKVCKATSNNAKEFYGAS